MSCKQLAEQYSRETGITIPPASATKSQKREFLLQQEWDCYKLESDGSLTDKQTASKCDHEHVATKLHEKGFMAWVNERGLQCINRASGMFYETDETGKALLPGQNREYPPAPCHTVCWKTRRTSEMCFECVAQHVKKDSNLCPALSKQSEQTIRNTLRNTFDCQACMGENLDNENKLYNCILNEKSTFATWKIIVIAIGATLFLIFLSLGIYYFTKYQKSKQIYKNMQMISTSNSSIY